jgi:5-methylcytosine-specific restriction protein B
MNFTKELLVKAIEKIDLEPNLRKSRSSSTYDLIYNGVKYPPILVLSVANQINGGKELMLSDYNNNVNIPFGILRDLGFEIQSKDLSFYDQLITFINQANTDSLKTSSYLKSYFNLNVKVSFGQGVSANVPWISFLGEGVSTSEGIYPVYLYYKKQNLLILAYGISETSKPKQNWTLENEVTIDSYFEKNQLEKPFRYGESYIYKVYNPTLLPDKTVINNDLNNFLEYYKEKISSVVMSLKKSNNEFNYNLFCNDLLKSHLNFSRILSLRFIASLSSKPFLILSGLSGSGKTKIAQSFVQWISESDSQYKIVPVGADWTNREPILGYPNGLKADEYITPESGVIHLLLDAVREENKNKPFFLILDEMNLSHVERYFADFLSIMESNDTIKLYTGNDRKSLDGLQVPFEISWPKNVFIIGTVNIDETTYMFSPKVLDRANVIEFRITNGEITSYLENPSIPDLTKLNKQGVSMAESFLTIASQKVSLNNESIAKELVLFFNRLKPVGAEFGYRSATEIMQLVAKLKVLDSTITENACLDIAIMQKLLPKLHGSRSKLVNVLIALGEICLIDAKDCKTIYFDALELGDLTKNSNVKYPISFEKLIRMYKNVLANGFTSYAEA